MAQRTDHHFVAMGGPCRLRIDNTNDSRADRAIADCVALVEQLEARYSRYRPDSLVSRINAAAGESPVAIDGETAGLLHYADTLHRESGGLFDLTSGILRRAWDFRSGRLPAREEVEALLPLVGWRQLEWNEKEIRLPRAGMELDFGGCVKEYAADAVAGRLRELGITHALVDLAGDMVAVGPQGDGQPWQVGIRHPSEDRPLATVALSTGALASSGDYQRCMVVDGLRYGHILDPRTGWPVQGLVAASVLADQCLVAGSGATVALLQSEQEGLDWLLQLGLPWLAVDRALQCHRSPAVTRDAP